MGFLKALFGGKEESAEEKAQKENERKFDILKYDGVRARKAGEIEYAVRCFREALTYGKDVETMSFLAEALVAGKKPEEAYEVLETQAELEPGRIGTRLSMAHVDEILQNFERMDHDCTAALQIDPDHANALYLSGKAKHALHDELNAVALLTRAILQDEHLWDAYLLRAEILQAMGSLKDAETDIDHLLQAPEPEEEALMKKAELRLQQNDAEQAILYYNKVKTQNPLLGKAYVGLSTAYSVNRQLDRALETMNEALEIMPDYGEGYKERGRIKMLLNDKAGSLDDLKKAIEADPETAKSLEGKFTNIEQEMNEAYRFRNPYGF